MGCWQGCPRSLFGRSPQKWRPDALRLQGRAEGVGLNDELGLTLEVLPFARLGDYLPVILVNNNTGVRGPKHVYVEPMDIQQSFELPHAPNCLRCGGFEPGNCAAVLGVLEDGRNAEILVEPRQCEPQLLMFVNRQVSLIAKRVRSNQYAAGASGIWILRKNCETDEHEVCSEAQRPS
jgi:hypothetical protein